MKTVRITRSSKTPYCFVNADALSVELVKEIDETLSYHPAGFERTIAFQTNKWDGVVRLFRRANSGSYVIPCGLVGYLTDILEGWEIPYEIVEDLETHIICDNWDFFWNPSVKLYDYQQEAYDELKKAGFNGIVALPTAAGKTYIASKIIYDLQEPTLILVHRKELLYQWQRELLNLTGVEATLVGDGLEEFSEVTIAMVQTLSALLKSRRAIGFDYQILMMDECFVYDTIVITDIGNLKIGYIVENKIECSVLTHTGDFKRILNFFANPRPSTTICIDIGDSGFECTPSHRILTNNRGWVQAAELKIGDSVIYYDQLQMQNLWKGVCNPRSTRGACQHGSYASRTPRYDLKEVLGFANAGAAERKVHEIGAIPTCMAARYHTDVSSKADDSRESYGRYEYILRKQIQQFSQVGYKAWHKAISICGLEVFNAGKSNRNSTKGDNKWWLRRDELRVFNTITPMSGGNIQSRKDGWKNSVHRGVAIAINHTNIVCSMVFGRWWPRGKTTLCESVVREDNPRGRGDITCLVGASMENCSPHKHRQEGIGVECNQQAIGKPDIRVITGVEIRSTSNAIQDSVFDLEVEDDHSYTANGVVVHNCHTIPCDTAYDVAMACNAGKRIGLSATPKREDGSILKMIGAIGRVVARIGTDTLISRGYLATPKFKMIRCDPVSLKTKAWAKLYKAAIVENIDRNEHIITEAERMLGDGRQVYIHVSQIQHGNYLAGCISGSVFCHASSKGRKDIIADFESGKIRCLISTLLKEGVSINGISGLIYASGMKSEVSVIQTIGRCLRIDPTFGDSEVIDFFDSGNRILLNHTQNRMEVYRETYGKYFKY